jgi:hypothetical protein
MSHDQIEPRALEEYSRLTDGAEAALDEADDMAEKDSRRLAHAEVFGALRRKVND